MITKLLPRGFVWIIKLFRFQDLIKDISQNDPSIPQEIQDKIDSGDIQDVANTGGVAATWWANLLSCFSSEIYRFEEQVIALLREAIPGLSTASGLLPHWEKVAGLPDDCMTALGGIISEEDRQIAVHSKLINEGQTTTKIFLIAYALNYGFTITIRELNSTVDSMVMGVGIMGVGVMGGAGENTVLEITVVSGSGNLPLLQCVFNRLIPAHCVLVWLP